MSVEDFSEAMKRKKAQESETWNDPVPLYAEHQKPAPYPIDALPPIIRNAVETYQAFGRQPIELVASSALATVSLACQGLADVDRDGSLSSPCSMAFLTVGVSGERKTATDTRFRRASVEWQADKRKEQAPSIKGAERRLAIWQAKRDGMVSKIKRLSGSLRAEDEIERDQLESKIMLMEPEQPKVPPEIRLFHEDTTPEKLAVNLAEGWPSASLWTDEGGLIVGSHAMSEGVALRFLALLNRLWDGNEFDRQREARSCAHIRGRRFTVSLMVQPSALAALISAGGGIARGVGALARFLMAWPTSTIGTREYRPGDLSAPSLKAFDQRVRQLLDRTLPLDEDGALQPPKIMLSNSSFEAWRILHNNVERELYRKGEFADVVDVGAKIAEQAARLAGALHVFEHGPQGEVGRETFLASGRIALWHLHEARRIFNIIGGAGETVDAQVLLDWLIEQTDAPLIGQILRLGPYRLRDKKRRDAAIEILAENGIARVEIRDGRQYLVLNPKVRP